MWNIFRQRYNNTDGWTTDDQQTENSGEWKSEYLFAFNYYK